MRLLLLAAQKARAHAQHMDVMEPLVNVGFVTRGFVGSNAVNDNTDQIRGSIVVSISACHAEDPGSIPGRGGMCHCPVSAGLLADSSRKHYSYDAA